MRSFLIKHITAETISIWIADNDNENDLVSIAVICYFEVLPSGSNLAGKAGYIKNVNTHSDYQRQGLATKVLTKALQEAKEKGIKVIYLGATEQGISLYKKLGFKLLETEMRIDL